jgi:hypothetical protein
MEPSEFEKQVREHLRIRKLLDEVRKEIKGGPEEGFKRWLTDLVVRAKVEVHPPRS